MPIDVFLRWYPQNALRLRMAQAVRERLRMLGLRPVILYGGTYDGDGIHVVEPYHINSKRYAEKISNTEIYCVIDDDQLPIPDDFFDVGAATLARHPNYGMLSGFPQEYAVAGQPYAERREEVIEAHSIGCPYFVKRGTLSFPDGPLRQYDGILSKVVTDQGLKTGFVRQAAYTHMGYGLSQIGYEP